MLYQVPRLKTEVTGDIVVVVSRIAGLKPQSIWPQTQDRMDKS